MMWMGRLSAWMAMAMAVFLVLLALLGIYKITSPLATLVGILTTALLAIGGYRTLHKMSGGLRLLSGAWGLAAGLLLLPIVIAAPAISNMMAFGGMIAAPSLIALAGLALTVLHKEK